MRAVARRIAAPAAAIVAAAALMVGAAAPRGDARAGRMQDTESRPAEAPAPWTRIDVPSLAACGGCHLQVWEEWSRSLHARAWTNENARAATRDFAVSGCRACHSPMPVIPTGLDRRPDYRDFNQVDGVHCLSCHGLAEGVAASRTDASAPCRPTRSPELLSARSCWPCHEPTHQAYAEYEQSDAFAIGLRCADCHMPVRADGSGRSHGPHGGLDPEFVKKGIRWSARRVDTAIEFVLTNRTGHKFPGEIPSRAFVVRLDRPGVAPEYATIRRPDKGSSAPDERLAPNETRTLRFEAPEPEARLRLLWKPFPLMPDAEAFLLGEWP